MIAPKTTLVRPGYTEQDTWRQSLGNSEPLHCFSLLGQSLDAPEVIPAGAMQSCKLGALPAVWFREVA